jgi:hypothetical protein
MKSPFQQISLAIRRRVDQVFPVAGVSAADADGVRFGEPFVRSHRLEARSSRASPPSIAIDLPARRCLFIDGGLLWPANGIVADLRGRAIVETAWSADRLDHTRKLGALGRFPIDVSSGVSTAIELGGWWNNYYHVLIDVLPRILGLHTEECQRLDSITVHLCALASPQWRPLIEALLPKNACIHHSEWDSRVRCRVAIALPFLSGDMAGCLPDEWLTRFRSATARLWGPATTTLPRRLYITRRLATMRRILNEDKLVAGLRSYGYEPIALESLSLAEQHRLFSTAEAVVAPHGAGLTNLIHAPAGCEVVELFPAEPSFHYRWLSRACQHPYASWIGGATTRNADFLVDVDAVSSLVSAPFAG